MRSNASLKYYIAVEREKEEGEEEKKVKRKNEIGSGGARKRERGKEIRKKGRRECRPTVLHTTRDYLADQD